MSLLSSVLGRRLANREQSGRRIGWFEAVPAMGLDSLASASYGPEAALAMLIPVGLAGPALIGPLMAPIVLLLGLLYFSYRQTILAYPTNGGAYLVARENLGRLPSLAAAAALMIDYTLNVAVGISAGVGALTSTIPSLHEHALVLCLAILALIAIANLRGAGEAGWLFALPTYLFIVSFLGLMAIGLLRAFAEGGHPHPVAPPPPLTRGSEPVNIWITLRAFAAGCTAMTGVEAISNGVGAFKAPVVQQAHRTLTIICVVLALLLAGVAVLARVYGFGAMDQTRPGYQSVLSQLAAAVVGHGAAYYMAMASALAVLCLSANTSFVGFPRLCKLVADDGYLPRPFARADRRLVFSVSIGFMTAAAAGLLIVFEGVTDRLIPLFALGAFLSFTLSQCGMVAHWRKQGPRHRFRMAVNTVGALATSCALLVILTAKFAEGAWIVVLVAPATIGMLYAIHRYYVRLEERIAVSRPFQVGETAPPTVLVAVEKRSRMTDRALQFAMTISPDVIAVHLARLDGPDDEENLREVKRRWDVEVTRPIEAMGHVAPRLVVLPAPYRKIADPLLALLAKIDDETPGRSVAVLIPELVLTHWWERLLHSRRSGRLREALLAKGGPRLNVIITPWRS